MKRRLEVLHSFLIALSPVLFLYVHNIEQVLLYDILVSAVFVLGLAVVVLSIFLLIFRDLQKAAIFSSFFLLFFFLYGQLYSLREIYDLRERYLLVSFLGPLGISLAWFFKTRRDLSPVSRFLNIFAVIFVAFSLVSLGIFKLREVSPTIAVPPEKVVSGMETPDIYYFLVDGYASPWELKTFYGNDNEEFLDYLSVKGFYVVPESRSNYAKTEFSLTTILNLDYLESLSATGKVSSETIRPPLLLQNHLVWQFLKPRGYRYLHFGSWWEGTYKNRYADVNVNQGYMPEFPQLLYKSVERLLPWQPVLLDVRRLQWERTLYQFNELAKVPARDGKRPVFVFAHLITHSPWVFNEDGSFLEDNDGTKVNELGREQYLNQLLFLNKKLTALTDEILKKSKTPPIIVIQSDHGSRDVPDEPVTRAGEYSDEYLRRHLRNFSALYLPNGGDKALWKDITPVNTFRVIFSYYFGGDYPPLSDRSFIAIPGEHYNLVDVTERVIYE